MIIEPNHCIPLDTGGPTKSPIVPPTVIVTIGVIISNLVLFDINFPISIPTNAAIKAPRGSPGPCKRIPPSTKIFLILSFQHKPY